jgi:glutamine amidotransferase
MGWNNLDYFMDHPLMTSISPEDLFYFVHSYHYEGDMKYKLCLTHYGYTFASGLHYENIMGIQFHPEKSYKSGLKLIENFSKL